MIITQSVYMLFDMHFYTDLPIFFISCPLTNRIEEVKEKMKRTKTILTTVILFISFLTIALSPMTMAISPVKEITTTDTTTVRITIGRQTTEKEMSQNVIKSVMDIGASCKEDFLTIYNKQKTSEEVAQAFENIQPFFQAMIDNDLTDKTIDELNTMYEDIRGKIREPRNKLSGNPTNGPQPTGLWNGVPTPIWMNVACGIFDAGTCTGFALGTHTILPTIGADLFITYAYTGTSTTVGRFGATISAAAFQVILGFIGVLIATPAIMVGPYFMTGLCGFVFGIGA